jgi:hypothetical protein
MALLQTGRTAVVLALTLLTVPAWAQEPGTLPPDEARWERRARIRQERIERWERYDGINRDGVHLRILKSYSLPEGATASEPVVVLGGSARIDGHAEDDVVVIGGSLNLGPKAVVDGNVVTVGGSLVRDPGATVAGTIDEAAIPWPAIGFEPWDSDAWWPTVALWSAILRLSFILVLATLLTLAAPRWIGHIAGRPAATSGLLGAVTEVLFVPALVMLVVMLVVSIIGIPLLAAIPFLLAAFGVIWVAGFTGVSARLGRALRGRSDAAVSVGDVLVGYAAIVSVTLAAHVIAAWLGWLSPLAGPMRFAGMAIEYVAWTIGLGAAISNFFAGRRAVTPPFPAVQSGF